MKFFIEIIGTKKSHRNNYNNLNKKICVNQRLNLRNSAINKIN